MTSLELFGVYDRGLPNTERVVLRATGTVDLREYALMVGFKGADHTIFPAQDFFFWLGPTQIDGPAWVFVFTGKGNPKVSREKNTGDPVHSIYWNRPYLLFEDENVVPALIRFGEVDIYTGENKKIEKQPPPPSTIDVAKFIEEIQKLAAPKKQ